MTTVPTIKITADGPEVGVATARLLLQHALDVEAQSKDETIEATELARDCAIKTHTGAIQYLPPKVTLAEHRAWQARETDSTAYPSSADGST